MKWEKPERKKMMKEKLIRFIKKETVLCAAVILAVISSFFVPPSVNYVNYIDFRVLGILFCLMTVMAGLQKNGFFDEIGDRLLRKTKNTMQLSLVLVFLCFFFSMLITNDVSLITFVPFAILILSKCGQEKLVTPVVVLQTLAANLGSMLTPIGNPQNLYLYNLAGMSMKHFLGILAPYTAVSGILLLGSGIWISRDRTPVKIEAENQRNETKDQKQTRKRKNRIYLLLFLISLLVVMRLLPYYVAFVIVLVTMLLMDSQVLKTVDYSLLVTFVAFFIFTGNIGNVEKVCETLQRLVGGHEVVTGVVASQVISNVPAALLLSGFTSAYEELLIGVNIGGLGTLIASMASLISYKLYAQKYNEKKGKYFFWFTIANVGYLTVLLVLYGILNTQGIFR